MEYWLSGVGSPLSKIEKFIKYDYKIIRELDYNNFKIIHDKD